MDDYRKQQSLIGQAFAWIRALLAQQEQGQRTRTLDGVIRGSEDPDRGRADFLRRQQEEQQRQRGGHGYGR